MTASFTYNPASQLDRITKNIDAYAYTPVATQDVVSAANGFSQLVAATPGSGQTSVPMLAYDARGNLTGIGSNAHSYTSENRLATASNGTSINYEPSGNQALRLKKARGWTQGRL